MGVGWFFFMVFFFFSSLTFHVVPRGLLTSKQ